MTFVAPSLALSFFANDPQQHRYAHERQSRTGHPSPARFEGWKLCPGEPGASGWTGQHGGTSSSPCSPFVPPTANSRPRTLFVSPSTHRVPPSPCRRPPTPLASHPLQHLSRLQTLTARPTCRLLTCSCPSLRLSPLRLPPHRLLRHSPRPPRLLAHRQDPRSINWGTLSVCLPPRPVTFSFRSLQSPR